LSGEKERVDQATRVAKTFIKLRKPLSKPKQSLSAGDLWQKAIVGGQLLAFMTTTAYILKYSSTATLKITIDIIPRDRKHVLYSLTGFVVIINITGSGYRVFIVVDIIYYNSQ